MGLNSGFKGLTEDRERTAGISLSVQALDCGMDGPGFRVRFLEVASPFYSCPKCPNTYSAYHSPGFFPGDKTAGASS